MIKTFRQGELLFIKVSGIKGIASKDIGKPKGDLIIREGEVSGHLHEVKSKGASLLIDPPAYVYPENKESVNLPAGQMFLRSDNSIAVIHPEHKTLKLDKGDYVIRIQREYEENGSRMVAD